MNEKIKQLTRQALDECKSDDIEMIHAYMMDKYGIVEIPQCFSEKFAELIVQECVGIVEDYGLLLISSDENYLGETLNLSIRVQEAGNKIKQHFGVEE